MSASAHELAPGEAVPLAHALVARAAADHDVRVLFIKGPVAGEQALRPPRPSVDVDVLVDPVRRGLLAAVLDDLGWVDENPYLSPTVLPQHSLTHRHESWPCELDLHDRFPGFFADPQAVFETLWSRRTTVRVAGRDIPAPDRAGHALILALHSLRDPHEVWRQVDLHDLEQRLAGELDAADLRDLAHLARVLGAADTAAPFLRAVGAPPIGLGSTSAGDLRAWRLRTEPTDTTAVSWVEELRHLKLRAWPHYLWYAAVLSDQELRLADPGMSSGRAALARARWGRLSRGLAALPGALRHVRSAAREEARAAKEVSAPAGAEIVIVTLLRPEGDTGVQTHVQTLMSHLESQGHKVSLVTPFAAHSILLRPVFAARIPLRWLSRPLGVWWYRKGHAHYLRRALLARLASSSGPRVIYAQCPVSADVALSSRTTERVVMVQHFNVSQADEWAVKGHLRKDGRMFWSIRSFEERVLSQLDGIVHVSEFARALIEARVPRLAHIPSATIPNFVALPPRVSETKPVHDLITVGTLEARKNQGYLLQILASAAASGQRYSLSVVGDGPDRARLERRVASMGLADDVQFLGYRADSESLMRAHRVYCHTAIMENLPLVVLEAMAEGLPVIAAAVGGIPSVVHADENGAFWPLDDPHAAAQVLMRVMTDRDRLREMSENARATIEREFTADVVVPRLQAFLLGLAG